MEVDPIAKLTKDFIRLLPIREHIEKFKVDIKLLDYDVDQCCERFKIYLEQLPELPKLENSGDSDVSSLEDATSYSEPTETNSAREAKTGDNKKPKEKTNNLKDASAYMLEEKISINQEVFAMLRPRKPWVRCVVLQIIRKFVDKNLCRPIFKFKVRTVGDKDPRVTFVDKFSIALIQDHGDMLRATKRVIAGYSTSVMMPGIIGFEVSEETKKRYLVHMDDGTANYFKPEQVYPIFGQSALPWKDARRLSGLTSEAIEYEAFLNYFFRSYPKRYILSADINQKVTIKRKGEIVNCVVVGKDCDVLRVLYDDNVEESIFAGSSRFSRRIETVIHNLRFQNPLSNFITEHLLIYMSIYTNASRIALDEDIIKRESDVQKARKSTGKRPPKESVNLDGVTVFEDRNDIKDWDTNKFEKSKLHKCSPECLEIDGVKTETSVADIVGEFRELSDLKIPLCLGWKRDLYRLPPASRKNSTPNIQVVYEAPCKKLLRTMVDIRTYLNKTESIFDIDYFSFDRDLVMNRTHGRVGAYHFVKNIAKDKRSGRPLENKFISLINQFDQHRLAFDFEYRNQTHPHSALSKRGFSFNKEFKSGCDCDGDCNNHRSACQCQILNQVAADSNTHLKGAQLDKKCQYTYKRLSSQVVTGIFECNEFCKCSSKCPNRVVQNGIRFRLQVRRTLKKGWGVISLDDIPAGAFICTYSAELLDDADEYGDCDMYYADLDFITVNEQQKEGYDSEKDEGVDSAGSDDDTPSPEPDSKKTRGENGVNGESATSHSRYPKRKVGEEKKKQRERELLERARRIPFVRIHEVLDSHDYTLDARVQGNIGRFFNHSCDPNTFVQNVFIDTHDLRFPVVAFFANKHIKAHDEITWNYNYSMGAIPGRRIDCHCEAANCRGRIL